jgi:hypothetical protein
MQERRKVRRRWTPEEDEYLRQNYPCRPTAELLAEIQRPISSIYDRVYRLGLKKSAEFKTVLAEKASNRIRGAGKSTRIQPGTIPWNKGKPHPSTGRTAETQFKPGGLPHTWRPIGTRRVTKDGYLEEKVTDTGYTPADYVPLHHLVWTEAGNPPVPKSHALVFRDGDKRNFAVENLELITRAELMRRNTYHRYGPEMSRVVQLRGVIARKINQHKRKGNP